MQLKTRNYVKSDNLNNLHAWIIYYLFAISLSPSPAQMTVSLIKMSFCKCLNIIVRINIIRIPLRRFKKKINQRFFVKNFVIEIFIFPLGIC